MSDTARIERFDEMECSCGLPISLDLSPEGEFVRYSDHIAALAAERAKVDRGKLWSFFRQLLSQGGDIQVDYTAGKYKSYEEYSARLDAAARERVDEWIQAQASGKEYP